jgi:hypothetical protein
VDECGRPLNKDFDIQNQVNLTYQNLIAQTDAKLLGDTFKQLYYDDSMFQQRRMGKNN